MSKEQGVTIGGEFLSFEHLKKKSENSVELCEKIGVGAPAWPYRAILALLNHIEAQQGERAAFVAGAQCVKRWITDSETLRGELLAAVQAEAATRYPDAAETTQPQRPMPTREQVMGLIDKHISAGYMPESGADISGQPELADAIMALLTYSAGADNA